MIAAIFSTLALVFSFLTFCCACLALARVQKLETWKTETDRRLDLLESRLTKAGEEIIKLWDDSKPWQASEIARRLKAIDQTLGSKPSMHEVKAEIDSALQRVTH